MPPPPFDYYIHLMSIPHALGTELATIPAAVPYLRADPVKSGRWTARIEGPGLKVGVAWAGNPAHLRDRQRSIPLDALGELWQLQGIRYFSLQKPLKPGESENSQRRCWISAPRWRILRIQRPRLPIWT